MFFSRVLPHLFRGGVQKVADSGEKRCTNIVNSYAVYIYIYIERIGSESLLLLVIGICIDAVLIALRSGLLDCRLGQIASTASSRQGPA